jgi:alkylation response protein AidB-like acyl-CoA dehydrogenase
MAAPETTAKAAPADRSSAIAPDTRGQNFYEADTTLRDLLALYLPADLLAHLAPHLESLGHDAANALDEAAFLADRHPPILHNRDRFGRDHQRIEFHPAYRDLERLAFGRYAIHAMSHVPVLGWPTPLPATAKHAFTFLFNQAEFGLGCPINLTDSAAHVIRLFADDRLKAELLPRMTTTDMSRLWQGAQFMTEKEGGSDVGRATTTARRAGDGTWRITGDKWFCSNADADVALLLARPEGAGPGTKGLGLFVVRKILPDGTPNHYRIVRLKDKLGTRSMASGEILLDGAVADVIGEPDRGFVQMAEMVNWSRLSNGVKSSALMRRAYHDARAVMTGRTVFGARLDTKPLAQRQMLKIALPGEQSLSMWLFTAGELDRAEGHAGAPSSQTAAAVLRLATPTLKLRATRDARRVTGDALEMRGGIGYVEEFITPRLVRDAHLGSVWEGTSNIVALDAVTRAVRRHHAHEPYAATIRQRLADIASHLPPTFVATLGQYFDRAIAFMTDCARNPDDEAAYRQAVTALYHATSAILMAWEGVRLAETKRDARRLLWARLVLDHKLTARDPFARGNATRDAAIASHLLCDQPAPLAEIAPLLS